jgi:PAS domain S-box-containing protein
LSSAHLTGKERILADNEFIVSKTDLKGFITYSNEVFQRMAGYSEMELMGKPHNLIRHPDMPHCVFKLLWDTLKSGKEIFAYVINRSRNGDHYWVLAHVTPDYDSSGQIIGYNSFRRSIDRKVLETIIPLYAMLREEEVSHGDLRSGMQAALTKVTKILAEKGMTYDQFVFSL